MKLKNNKVYKIKIKECGCEYLALVNGDKINLIEDDLSFRISEAGETFEVISKVSTRDLFEKIISDSKLEEVFTLLSAKKTKLLEEENLFLAREISEKEIIIKYLEKKNG